MRIVVDAELAHEVGNLHEGMFDPVREFMDGPTYSSVVHACALPSGEFFPFPITLALSPEVEEEIHIADVLHLVYEGRPLAVLEITDLFQINVDQDLVLMFGTDSREHPGIRDEIGRSRRRFGAKILAYNAPSLTRHPLYRTPAQVRQLKAELGLATLAGFQTRNAVHRAHEHLIRIAMELAGGVLIQPLIGKRKAGDFTAEAIVRSYEVFIEHFLPPDRVIFSPWHTIMRYAGPREAALHMLVRRNFGCDYFVLGRDQAGVGEFYGKYEAQEFCEALSIPGIRPLALSGPFYCSICEDIVSERTCRHDETAPDAIVEISGTEIRRLLLAGEKPAPYLMRPEVAESLLAISETKEIFL